MAKYSDWRSDLREVMDDDTDNKKVTGKGVNNNKLIKINPKLGEAVEQIGGQILEVAEVDTVDGEEEDKAKKFEKEKQDKIEDKNKKKEMMLKNLFQFLSSLQILHRYQSYVQVLLPLLNPLSRT